MTRYTYQHLLELVDGDHELITLLVEEGEIVRGDNDVVTVNVEHVLVARTLLRDLDVSWPGIEIILRLRRELAEARKRLAERDQ
ncbi:MAG: hypothetical protein JO257_37010 [Deltaproteobacteria bacterium]|nr:hypothetical protein [Deltaproteobacteria bacterium]